MPTTLNVKPVTRLEGHLDIELTIEQVNGKYQVLDAKSGGVQFRGFEIILKGRQPMDALHYTQRICGVCPISHGMAASYALESAAGFRATTNGRILRNLVLGSNFVMSHILHFYHLAALDYVDTTGILDIAPWAPHYSAPDMVKKGQGADALVQHYVTALEMRRKAHQMGAIFGGKLPCTPTFFPGGSSETVTTAKISAFRTRLTELRGFIDGTYIPDVKAVASKFPAYAQIGRGCGNLLAYGVFDQEGSGAVKLLKRGRYTSANNAIGTVDPAKITEHVGYSWYTPASGGKNPSAGVTEPSMANANAYSWLKAPRYDNGVYEVGPLARMWVNGDYRAGISVIDRVAARAFETKKVADAMNAWLGQLQAGQPAYRKGVMPVAGTGIGLTEAPRGALGHWVRIANSVIDRYQVVSATTWNASPKDDAGRRGPIEQALIGTKIADPNQPIEVLRVVHSFDPCLSCSVHMVRPHGDALRFVISL